MNALPSSARHQLVAVLRLALGGVFLWAGLAKLHAPAELAASIASFRLVPPTWIPLLADSLPFLEALTGCWLLLGWRPRAPTLAALLLSTVFLLAAAQAAGRGLDVNCACFGPRSAAPVSLVWLLGRDLALLAAALVVWRHARTNTAVGASPSA